MLHIEKFQEAVKNHFETICLDKEPKIYTSLFLIFWNWAVKELDLF